MDDPVPGRSEIVEGVVRDLVVVVGQSAVEAIAGRADVPGHEVLLSRSTPRTALLRAWQRTAAPTFRNAPLNQEIPHA